MCLSVVLYLYWCTTWYFFVISNRFSSILKEISVIKKLKNATNFGRIFQLCPTCYLISGFLYIMLSTKYRSLRPLSNYRVSSTTSITRSNYGLISLLINVSLAAASWASRGQAGSINKALSVSKRTLPWQRHHGEGVRDTPIAIP